MSKKVLALCCPPCERLGGARGDTLCSHGPTEQGGGVSNPGAITRRPTLEFTGVVRAATFLLSGKLKGVLEETGAN